MDGRTLIRQWDADARRAMDSMAPFRFALAQGPRREAVFGLRYREVVDRGWCRPEDLPDGMERDCDDDDALQLAVWEGATLAGAARVVLPQPGRWLPAERSAGVTFEPVGQVVEVGRVIVAPAYRDRQQDLFFTLLCACWLMTRAAGFSEVGGTASRAMLKIYGRLGFQMRVLGPAFESGHQRRNPVLVDWPASIPALSARAAALAAPREPSGA